MFKIQGMRLYFTVIPMQVILFQPLLIWKVDETGAVRCVTVSDFMLHAAVTDCSLELWN